MNHVDISKIGVKTDFAEFASASIDGERLFRKTVAALHSVNEENVTSTIGGSQAIFIAAFLRDVLILDRMPFSLTSSGKCFP